MKTTLQYFNDVELAGFEDVKIVNKFDNLKLTGFEDVELQAIFK